MGAPYIFGPQELEELRYLRACGFSQRDLARCFFVHQTTIAQYLRRIGDPLDRGARTPWWCKEAA